MEKLFIEATSFTKAISEMLGDEALSRLQRVLMADPEAGDVIPGCGGLRKIRIPDPRRQAGKRGGVRVIYLHIPDADWIFFLDAYGKGEKADLTAKEKKSLRRLVATLKEEALRSVSRKRKRTDG